MKSDLRRPRRIFVVDDHPVVREGFRSMLSSEDVEVVGEAESGAEAIRRIGSENVDVVLLDMKLPDLDGSIVVRRLKETSPNVSILVISMHDDPRLVREAIDAGAAGYTLKGATRRELLAAVRAICDGEAVLDPGLLRAIVTEGVDPRRPDLGDAALTQLEIEVLRLIAEGLTNAQISEQMRWSLATAKKYVQLILEKLEVSDRTQAAVAAMRRGLLR